MAKQWTVEFLPIEWKHLPIFRRQTSGADLIVTQGGASVGDHDLVQAALGQHGFVLDFWKIAMRPGKPLIFGRMQDISTDWLAGKSGFRNGLCATVHSPGNREDVGRSFQSQSRSRFLDNSGLPRNGERQDYVRALVESRDGELLATPFRLQDSSTQKIFAQADALIIRRPDAPDSDPGERDGGAAAR